MPVQCQRTSSFRKRSYGSQKECLSVDTVWRISGRVSTDWPRLSFWSWRDRPKSTNKHMELKLFSYLAEGLPGNGGAFYE
jgi:hypothetical protein